MHRVSRDIVVRRLVRRYKVAVALPAPGKEVETDSIRFVLWGHDGSIIEVTDKANIGKRGKTVSSFSVNNLNVLPDERREDFSRSILSAPSYKTALARAHRFAEEEKGRHTLTIRVSESEKRGVDVKPMAIQVDGSKVSGFVEVDGFSLSEKDYRGSQAQPNIQPSRSAKKPQLRKFYAWADKMKSRLGDMELGEILAAAIKMKVPVSAPYVKPIEPLPEPPPPAPPAKEPEDEYTRDQKRKRELWNLVESLRVGDKIELVIKPKGWGGKPSKVKTEVLDARRGLGGKPWIHVKSRARGGASISPGMGVPGGGLPPFFYTTMTGSRDSAIISMRRI